MSSKNLNKKSDDKNDKAEQQALKEVEIVAELAPNEKTRKEAEELIETVESASNSTVQEQERAIETVLDETKRAIKKTVNEAKREIPKYIKAIGDLQEGTIQATKEIGYDFIELQREVTSLVPQLQERYTSYVVPWMSPMIVTEYTAEWSTISWIMLYQLLIWQIIWSWSAWKAFNTWLMLTGSFGEWVLKTHER